MTPRRAQRRSRRASWDRPEFVRRLTRAPLRLQLEQAEARALLQRGDLARRLTEPLRVIPVAAVTFHLRRRARQGPSRVARLLGWASPPRPKGTAS